MCISTGKVFLVLLGFLYFERSNAMDPNHRTHPSGLLPNQISLEMDDGSKTYARVEWSTEVPSWIQPNQPHSRELVFYFKDMTLRVSGVFREPRNPHEEDDSTRHLIPKIVQIHTRFYETSASNYYEASPFTVYPLQNQQGSTPPGGYVYVSVPNGHVYRAPLRFTPLKDEDDMVKKTHPRIAETRDKIIQNIALWGMK